MDQIYHLDSDSSILDELWNCIRNRNIEQKFIYQGDWAKLYYLQKHSNKMYTSCTLKQQDFLSFFENNIHINSEKLQLISLWCWNSENEKFLFEHIQNKNLTYIWVDSSKDMLDLSIEKLKNLDLDKKFICADFSSRKFRHELKQLTKQSEDRLFVFFSNTFWNINHTNIIDILLNLLNIWEKIWLDVRVRKWTTLEDDLDISTILADDVNRKEVRYSFLKTLENEWVDTNKWELTLKTTKVELLNALKFEFSFNLKEKSIIDIKWDKIVILAWENIKLQQIYAYDRDGLINFFSEHWFKLLDKQIKWYRGQFLFEKI